ncbi:MAG: BspA family leucine-rich repeat surface protein, partial [Actinomycetota bacterium]|nr:BspA family leucine-rich repeat surface protein [Actinomycetota bacterium]
FNGDIDNWNTATVTNMIGMFYGATAFNQNISSWNTAAVTDMSYMFYGATAFNQSLGTWAVGNVTTMAGMLSSTGLSTANYDATLNGWANQSVKSRVALDATGLTYDAAGVTARNTLTGSSDLWTITGDSLASAPTIPTIAGATISGTASVGSTLSAVAGAVTGNPTPVATYQWFRGSNPISGATGPTYVVSSGDVGQTIKVTITETNTAGAASATSAATANVTSAPAPIVNRDTTPTISGTTISGTASVGSTLSAVPGTVTGNPAPVATYQWSRDANPITGATGPTYVVSSGDVGLTLTVTITETNGAGAASATSAATAVVAPTTTTTVALSPGPIFQSVLGRPAYMGETRLFVISGSNLAGLSVSSNGASVRVVSDAPTQLEVDVTPTSGTAQGFYVLTGRNANGSTSLHYSQRFNQQPLFTRLTGIPAHLGTTTLFTMTGSRLAGVKVSSNGGKVQIVKDSASVVELKVTPAVGSRPGSYILTFSDKYGWNTIKYNQFTAKK